MQITSTTCLFSVAIQNNLAAILQFKISWLSKKDRAVHNINDVKNIFCDIRDSRTHLKRDSGDGVSFTSPNIFGHT